MGGKFCFFTDPALLGAQADADAFGPRPAAGGNDLFQVTHRHPTTATGAPAIAICDGILCAQEDGSGGLTLILKPSQAPPFEAPVVSYFIYKGIDKASLLDGDAVLDENATDANDLTKRVAATWKALNADDLTGSEAGLGLDRDAAFLHDANDAASKVFTDADPVERLFTYPHKTVQLPVVAAGDVIGAFGSDCGLEIVLLRLGYRPKLKFARTADNVIAVPSLGGGPRPADDADWFTHWHAKEQALAFMDPAAYFGAFVQAKLYKRSGTSTSKVKGSDVYDELLTAFANKNVAWLDIRNNYSYSYNLFGLYEGPLRFASRSDASQTNDLDFRVGGWPLLRLQAADVPGGRRGSLHRTMLRLPAGLSVAPAVLLSKGFAKRLGPERPKVRAPAIAADADEPGFLTPIRIAFPAAKIGGQELFTASYTRINLYERPQPGAPSLAPLDVARGHHLDGVFRPRDLQLDEDFASNGLRFEIYQEEVLVDLEELNGPTYSASVAIGESAGNVTLFAFPSHILPAGLDNASPLPAWANSSTNENAEVLAKLAATFGSARITKRTIQPDSVSTPIDTIIVRNSATPSLNPVADRNSIEHYCFIVMTQSDHQSIGAQISGDTILNPALPVFLTAASDQTKTDVANEVRYSDVAIVPTGFAAPGGGTAAAHSLAPNQRIFRNAGI